MFIDPRFDLNEATDSCDLESLKLLEDYIDFSIETTIKKQLPNISEENERRLAVDILENYFSGDRNSFTSTHNIRNNISRCNIDKIISMLMRVAIEKNAYNKVVLRKLTNQNNEDAISDFVTTNIYNGYCSEMMASIKANRDYLNCLIEIYAETKYKNQYKDNLESISMSEPLSSKALEKLNLEMRLNKVGRKI